jgi:hypothetical protein
MSSWRTIAQVRSQCYLLSARPGHYRPRAYQQPPRAPSTVQRTPRESAVEPFTTRRRPAGGAAGELASPHTTFAAAYEVNRIDECHIAARSAVNRVAVAVAGMDPVVARREL